ncbi:MAG: hypothetical protein GDA48_00165 [Hormoscilla sp. GM102CHS1]|nr:hypothetical protein [Hormoscilla sp. GM102CHS1]
MRDPYAVGVTPPPQQSPAVLRGGRLLHDIPLDLMADKLHADIEELIEII